MFTILCIVGAIWVVVAAVFVFALASAAKKPAPVEQNESIVLEEAA
jgi:hypothetical protein